MENMDFKLEPFYPDYIPEPDYDALADPSLFFDYDAFADGLVPEATVPAQPPTTEPIPKTEDDDAVAPDFSSLFGDIELDEPQEPRTDNSNSNDTVLALPAHQPANVQPSPTTITTNKEACSADIFDALFAQITHPPAAELPADAPPPTAAAPRDIFPLESWPADEIDATFAWDLQPPLDLGLDFFASVETTAAGTSDLVTAQPLPDPLTAFFLPDVSAASAGEAPFTLDNRAAPAPLLPFPPVVSLTAPQSVPLQHPRPIAPVSPSFLLKSEPFDEAETLAPSSIIDAQGLLKATPASSVSPTPHRDLTTPVVNGKVIKRIPRPAKAKDVNADDWYEPLPAPPAPWGGSDPKNPLFQYNANGEWWPGQRLSRDDILYYLSERKRRDLPLTLWVQNLPHGCVKRVADARTLKCRWDGCPAQNGTILKGFWRVCIDERPATSGRQHNPFHNAGYMHLWCLDRCFDLLEISQAFDLRPDTRHFEKEERNPMAMTRDHDELVLEFENWRAAQQTTYEKWRALCETNKMLGLPTENRVVEREQKLWYILTTKHLALETVVRQTMRDNRGGISIDQHRGDLGWYCRKVNERKKHTKAQKEAGSRALARLPDCEELFSDDEDVSEPCVSRSRPKRSRHEFDDSEAEKENTGDRRARPHAGDARHSKLQEVAGNKRQPCVDDKRDFDARQANGPKRQRRHCRSI